MKFPSTVFAFANREALTDIATIDAVKSINPCYPREFRNNITRQDMVHR